MHWNNRLFEQEDGSLKVHEVFYGGEDENNAVLGWAAESELTDAFEDVDDAIGHLTMILEDLHRTKAGKLPVVKYDEWQRILQEAERLEEEYVADHGDD